MTCRDARAALLEADLADLRPGAEGPLAVHLAACPACRRAANQVLAATERLAHARVGLPGRTADAVAATARATTRQHARRRRLRVLVPLIAAASLAVLLLRNPRPDAPTMSPMIGALPPLPPIVDGGGDHVAVFVTNRPDVTVVWQF